MKPWTTWLARLGIAGACFIVTGCGGGDVPDASSDGQAVTESTSGTAPQPAPAANEGAKIAANEVPAPNGDEAAAEPTPPVQEPESPPANAKKEEAKGSSKTAEMLAMATGPSGGGSNPPADGSAPPADGSATPPGNTPASGESGANSNSGGPGGPGAGQGPGGPNMPGRPGMGPQQGQQGQQGEAQRRDGG